jgi:hypothetical protein
MQPVRVVCLRCAGRYALVVDPACPLCGGRGTVAVVVADGVQPWVAARALGLHIGDYWVGGTAHSKVESARLLPLLTADDDEAQGLADEPTNAAKRSAVGRAAGAWLVRVGLRKRQQRERKPRKTAAERAEEQRRLGEIRARAAERRRECEEDAKRLRVEAAALESLRAAHPEEFEEMVEREGPLLVIEEMWWA